jgi:hypothetical protein
LGPGTPERFQFGHYRPTGAKRVLSCFGVNLPKRKKQRPRLPPSVSIGAWSRDGEEIRMDRATLFDIVWSKSRVQLAKEWGMADVGLAKACRRLQIPLPGRGYWAKTRAGKKVRRPKLPELPEGEAVEIVVRIPFKGRRSRPPLGYLHRRPLPRHDRGIEAYTLLAGLGRGAPADAPSRRPVVIGRRRPVEWPPGRRDQNGLRGLLNPHGPHMLRPSCSPTRLPEGEGLLVAPDGLAAPRMRRRKRRS